MHDAIAATVYQCRRLIIIISPAKPSTDDKTEEVLLHDNHFQLCYEQKVGLHDALTQNDPRVILVEIGEDWLCCASLDETSERVFCNVSLSHYMLQSDVIMDAF